MTEHTDKSPQKPGRTPPRKRPGKAAPPAGKRATAPQDRGAGGKVDEGRADTGPAAATPPVTTGGTAAQGSLAPDPATVVFGSSRPIAAPPPKLPESSGLHFTGPSAGILKASGPQPTSPKAAGLTFTAAKAAPAKAMPVKPATAKPAAPKKAESKKPEPGKAEADSSDPKKAALTKPAIAPQASGRHFDKERSASGFVFVMLTLTVLGSGLAFWMQLSSETPVPQQAVVQPTPAETSDLGAPAALPAAKVPAVLADEPETAGFSGSLSGGLSGGGDLSAVELEEIQNLLGRLDFDPGSERGTMTAATTAAIRSYQEMAGLPADGEASRALLEELRSVAELYGS